MHVTTGRPCIETPYRACIARSSRRCATRSSPRTLFTRHSRKDFGDRRPLARTCQAGSFASRFDELAAGAGASRLCRGRRNARRSPKSFRDRLEAGRLLALLTERQRAVVVAHYYLGLTQAETADLFGVRPGTVSATIAQALTKMRKATTLA
jgi:RNA polymerase sigma factor (sigma-70 family)